MRMCIRSPSLAHLHAAFVKLLTTQHGALFLSLQVRGQGQQQQQVAPTNLTSAGGRELRIRGVNFWADKDKVKVQLKSFSGSSASCEVKATDVDLITCTYPGLAPDDYYVVVTVGEDRFSSSETDDQAKVTFGTPQINSIDFVGNTQGLSPAGGQIIVINGYNLALRGSTGETSVSIGLDGRCEFDGVDGQQIPTAIRCRTTAFRREGRSTVIKVTHRTKESNAFSVSFGAPTLTGVTPNRDISTAGELLTLSGTGFYADDTLRVTVDGRDCTIDIYANPVQDSEIKCLAPAMPPGGPYEVTVQTGSGNDKTTAGPVLIYYGAPFIERISYPDDIPLSTAGGQTITVSWGEHRQVMLRTTGQSCCMPAYWLDACLPEACGLSEFHFSAVGSKSDIPFGLAGLWQELLCRHDQGGH